MSTQSVLFEKQGQLDELEMKLSMTAPNDSDTGIRPYLDKLDHDVSFKIWSLAPTPLFTYTAI